MLIGRPGDGRSVGSTPTPRTMDQEFLDQFDLPQEGYLIVVEYKPSYLHLCTPRNADIYRSAQAAKTFNANRNALNGQPPSFYPYAILKTDFNWHVVESTLGQ